MAMFDNHRLWFLTAVFTTVALASLTSTISDIGDEESETKWAVSGVSLLLIFSTCAVFAHLFLREKFAETHIEGVLTLLTFGFWAAVLPGIMDGDHHLANASFEVAQEVEFDGIVNPNLFFSSWIAFLLSFIMFFRFLKKHLGSCDDESKYCCDKAWSGLLVASFVAMIAASRHRDDLPCDDFDSGDLDARCKRTHLAIAVGVISTVVCLLWMWGSKMFDKDLGVRINFVLVWILIAMWTTTVRYTNFPLDNSVKRPATSLGNLYFFTWGSFFMAVFMGTDGVRDLFGANRGQVDDHSRHDTGEKTEEQEAGTAEKDVQEDIGEVDA